MLGASVSMLLELDRVFVPHVASEQRNRHDIESYGRVEA